MSVQKVARPEGSARLEDRRGGLPLGMTAVSLLLAAFEDWLSDWQDEPGRWTAFDQFVRKQLHETCSATRVRCYRLAEGGDVLESLTPGKEPFSAHTGARDGIYGYVISRGHRYVRTDGLLGPAVHRLACEAPDPPAWCTPISYERRVLGLIHVGSLREDVAGDIPLLEALGCVISLLWGRLADREEMMLARRIDQGSGVLARANFFQASEHALADGYANHEPALVIVLVLEGIRGLDDRGLWDLRDMAVESAGQAIRNKLRSDDIVGRFADDRFVALMRRLDSSLGRIIARNLIESVQESLHEACGSSVEVVVRCGLAGTGQQQPPLQELLGIAIEAAQQARETHRSLCDDLDKTEAASK